MKERLFWSKKRKEQELRNEKLDCIENRIMIILANLTFKPQLISEYKITDNRINVYERSEKYNRNDQKKEEIERRSKEF